MLDGFNYDYQRFGDVISGDFISAALWRLHTLGNLGVDIHIRKLLKN
jgi:hypothetical protein